MLRRNKTVRVQSLRRGLKNRYMSMIALGGCIGTGLFITSGGAITSAGPGGALLAYCAIALFMLCLMACLGTVATHFPSGSFGDMSAQYIDQSSGFTTDVEYFLNWVFTVPIDIATVGIIMKFWFPSTPGWIWSLIALALIILINAVSVRSFGQTEYWMAFIKILAILAFLVVGVLTIFDIFGGKSVGFKNFTIGKAPFVGGFSSTVNVFILAGFAFQGTELVGITAGESSNPLKAVPKAIKQTFWRIMLFYVGSLAVMSFLIPYTSKALLGQSVTNITTSPFTLVFKNAGLKGAASLMNAIILIAVISAANSGLYAGTRSLYSMGRNNRSRALHFFGNTTKKGIPYSALTLTSVLSLAVYGLSFVGPKVYNELITSSSLLGFIAWLMIAIAAYRFGNAWIKQGHSFDELTYHAKWFKFCAIISIIFCLFIIVAQGYSSIASLDWFNILVTYFSVPVLLIVYFAYKWSHHDHVIPLKKIDVRSLKEVEQSKLNK
ncbi:amino acid permease [uncultured bacterium]|nr:amino acid permease [uncultured bacterium]